MTLLEQTYTQLRDAGLVDTGKHFSIHFLCRNSNWYSWQRHAGREISVGAAIECLRTVRRCLRCSTLSLDQRQVLEGIARKLLVMLNERHFITDVSV